MAFADPESCPACRGRLDGSPQCPSCGLDLTTREVAEVWQALLHADGWLAQAIAQRDAANRPSPKPHIPPPPAPSVVLPPPTVEVPSSTDRSWSVGTILLGLGAFGLVVAALIFVSRSWDSLGLAGKAAVMLAATAACGAVAAWVTKRPLRASAEALWAVFLSLVVVDVAGARSEGLAGLDGLRWEWIWLMIGLLLVLVSGALLMWSRRPIGRDLWVPAIGAVTGVAIAGGGVAGVVEANAFWCSFAGLVVVGLLGLSLRVTVSRFVAIGSRIVLAVFYCVAGLTAFIELADHPTIDEVVAEGHGVPMLLVTLAALVVAATVPALRIVMTALAVVGALALVAMPAGDEWTNEGGLLAVAGFAAIFAVGAARGSNDWSRGARLGGVVPIVLSLLIGVWWLGVLLAEVGRRLESPWIKSATGRFPDTSVSEVAPWVTCVIAVLLVVAALGVRLWPELKISKAWPVVFVVVLFVVPGLVVGLRLSWLLIVIVGVMIATTLTAVHTRQRTDWSWSIGAQTTVWGGAAIAASAQGAAAVSWVGGGMVLAALALMRHTWAAWFAGAGVATLLAAGAATITDLAGGSDFWVATTAVCVALAVMLLSVVFQRTSPTALMVIEWTAASTLFVALCTVGGGTAAAAVWTLVGVALCAVAASIEHRSWYVIGGVVALVVGYALLISDTTFTFVEAYTLPIGLLCLVAGAWWKRRRPETHSWLALGVGLCICLLPSVPQAMAEPTELRALLLGVGGIAVLAVGAKFDWQAPFVMGCIVVLLVLLCNIGPYANAAPRVVVIAVASTVLIAVGITWEDRVRDGRKVMAFLKAMG